MRCAPASSTLPFAMWCSGTEHSADRIPFVISSSPISSDENSVGMPWRMAAARANP